MKIEEIISYSFSGLMLICMFIIIFILVRREFLFSEQPYQSETRQVKNWRNLDFHGYRTGPSDALVQIVEFFDYQCPYCKRVQAAVKAIQEKYSAKVSITHENFPLKSHQYAKASAVAAECARRQGAFIAYHDSLFANQNQLGHLSYMRLAARTGITDTTAFHRCIENKETVDLVKFDQTLGKKLNVSGIPTFIINGKLILGVLSRHQLDELVQRALIKADP